MERTIIHIQDFRPGNQPLFSLVEPSNHPEAGKLYAFACPPNEPPLDSIRAGELRPEMIKPAGRLLYKILESHPAFENAMQQAAATNNEPWPLYIYLDSGMAEDYPWEALFRETSPAQPEPNGFLSLDMRWPIGRMVQPTVGLQTTEKVFESPLRILAVMAAAGVEAQTEWIKLSSEIRAFMQSTNIPYLKNIRLRVLVCEETLYRRIDADKDPMIEVAYVGDKANLLTEIERFRPNLMHLFCHGDISPTPHLEIATRRDWELDAPGSIRIEANELRQITDLQQYVWLITLNCCNGAKSNGSVPSLARALVSYGFPIVVGMREKVAVSDAEVFCGAYYPALLNEIARSLESNPGHFDCVRVLHTPRTRLCYVRDSQTDLQLVAAASKEWTFPVIYVNTQRLLLRRQASSPQLSEAERTRLQEELTTLRTTLKGLKTLVQIPADVLAEIEHRIAEIDQKLYA